MAQEKKKSLYGSSTQKQKYGPALSGYKNLFATSWPPQKRSSVPGFTAFNSIPAEPQSLMTEDNYPMITENNNQIIT